MPIHETTLSPWNAPGSTAPAKQSLPGPAPETSYGENKKAARRPFPENDDSGFSPPLAIDPVDDFTVRRIAADGFPQQLANPRVVVLLHGGQQLLQHDLEGLPAQVFLVGPHDHRMVGGIHVVTDQQLFVELLARTQATELDGDVTMGRTLGTHAQAGQVDHLLGELQDLHRRPHVQHEYISALPHRTGLDDQLRCLGNGHEVTGDARVGDRHRAAALDLLAEQRNDRTGRTEDVAEADHGETGLVDVMHVLPIAEQHRCRFVAERLKDHLRQALGAAHHIGRSHRLVGGNQHEVLHADLHRGLHRMQGAYHVVENALGDVVLDDRHMLVGRRMVDGIDLPGTHHVHQALGIAHRTEDRQQVHRKRLALDPTLQFLMDAVEVVFAVLEQDQHARRTTHDLPTEFRTDRTARPSHHHHLTADAPFQQLLARCDAVAPQQVSDVHLLQVVHLDPAAGQVHEAGHAAHVQRERLQGLENLSAPGPSGGRNRQENLLRARLVDHLADMLGGIDPQTGDDPVGDLLVVIDERHRTHRPTETQCRNQLVAGRPAP